MFPDRKTAMEALAEAGRLNPGPWTAHSENVALAAQNIAEASGLNGEKAYVLGLLHDIGRRRGVTALRHAVDGYRYAMSRGWDEAARICLTHSFPVQDAHTDIGKMDLSPEELGFLEQFLRAVTYDDYDKLIILCDCLADARGFCLLEKRFVDTTRRYGAFPFTVARWNNTFAIKAYFEGFMGRPVYSVLPGIEACIF